MNPGPFFGTNLFESDSIALPQRTGVRSVFFYAEVTTARIAVLTKLFRRGETFRACGLCSPLKDAALRTICWLAQRISLAKLCWR